jgi:hypothetical protein
MEKNLNEKYNDNLHSRCFILKEGIFKNTKKIMNIYNNSLMIENVDETEKEIIEFEKIENVVFSKENQKEFSISYFTNSEQNDIKLIKFSTNLRTQIIADILNLIVNTKKYLNLS